MVSIHICSLHLFVDICELFVLFFSKSVGDPIPSKKPPPDQKFEKSECGGYDRRGGGVIIPSIYVLDVVEGKTDYVVRELHNFTKNYDGCTERVIVENTSDSCPF